MRIANPIYDSVFKHLMEDREIAQGLISRLLGVPVLELTPQPQEITERAAIGLGDSAGHMRVYRIDFSAIVQTADGRQHRVLIELQKAGRSEAAGRFRTYLGRHYAMPPRVQPPLPIIAIYILGFALNEALPPVIKVKRQYLNGVTGAPVTGAQPEPFIENFTHDAVLVQIPEIEGTGDTDIERALAIFDQTHREQDPHYLQLSPDETAPHDPFVQKMLRTLLAAASDAETQKQMAVEDEVVDIFERLDAAERATMAERKLREAESLLKEQALVKLAAAEARLSASPAASDAETQKQMAVEDEVVDIFERLDAAERATMTERQLREAERKLLEAERELREEAHRNAEAERLLKEQALAELAALQARLASLDPPPASG